ncbi:3-oxoacyl-ACP synthase III family protein [Saccharothrix australiensis]|uniref:3-oxoacyl-[acyl-carrier-protein] synthase-3 n=1 Tax=Saccharothrix australiensis TaxID=2072 RepID=A0A495W1L0_9PSEU|nr:ketoacyl-ACP synthase III [Saccharothrix australiensis]RKT55516.1 3-oxoacyl-[acyl-carrier-protein] synthase-3 [Saccharothrix australiensis]
MTRDCFCGCALAEPLDGAGVHEPRTPVPGVGVLGCGSHLPEWEVGNDVVATEVGVEESWIERKTGIRTRRRAAPWQAASDLAAPAAEEALRRAGLTAADLSVVVVATSTPDSPQPATACVLQDRIGAVGAAAFDVNAVCSGFVFALETARRLIADGGHALVVGVDVYSRILDPTDRRTAVLFGDGAGAVVLGPTPPGRGIVASALTSYGQHADLIKVAAGGSRIPASKESLAAGEHYFSMDGRGVRDFVAREVPTAVRCFLADLGYPADTVRHFVPHQANGRMLAELEAELAFPAARAHYTVERYGNTGAASVPITLAAAQHEFAEGDVVVLAAFGGGMAMGLSLLHW